MNITDGLHDLVADEPPFVLDVETALTRGRRRRRVRQGAMAGSLVLVVGAVGAGVLLAAPSHKDVLTAAAQPPAAVGEPNDGSLFYEVVRAHTPESWTLSHMNLDGESWYANVDDGRGAQRVGLSHSRGGLQLHPCSDSEYVDGATCVETELSPTSRLIVRGVSHDGVYSSLFAEIVHPDGYGVEATIDNATWKDIPKGTVFTAGTKRELTQGTVVNPVPLYSSDQLVAMVKQYDAATG